MKIGVCQALESVGNVGTLSISSYTREPRRGDEVGTRLRRDNHSRYGRAGLGSSANLPSQHFQI